jgi:hypothetical protein
MFNIFFINPNFLDNLIKKTHIIILSIYNLLGGASSESFLSYCPLSVPSYAYSVSFPLQSGPRRWAGEHH